MSGEPVNNYELSLTESSLKPGVKLVTSLMSAAEQSELTVDQSGGFHEFKPMGEIPPYSTLIYLLTDGE
jgi:hypothetical protein